MKILFDPIPTGDINRCASYVKMKACMLEALKQPDVFCYFFVPDKMKPEEQAFLPENPRVRYIPTHFLEDRFKNYWFPSDAWQRQVAFNGELWDADMVVTNRTIQCPFLKFAIYRPGTKWLRKSLFLIEDMPIMSFKIGMSSSRPRENDMATLMGYLSADRTCISAFWEKALILDEARKYFSFSNVRLLQQQIIETSPSKVPLPVLKPEQARYHGQRKFTLSYAGRMIGSMRIEDSFDAMLNSWIMGGNDIRLILCTVSKNHGRVQHDIFDQIEEYRPQREEFWRIMREEADLGVFMSVGEDYSMTMLEPLLQGTPLIIRRSDDVVASIGKEYPFLVANSTEAYAVMKAFKQDYTAQYQKFAQWSQGPFTALMQHRNDHACLTDIFVQSIAELREAQAIETHDFDGNDVVTELVKAAPTDKPFRITKLIGQIENTGVLRFPLAWKEVKQFEGLRYGFSTHFDIYRHGLLRQGFVDAGTEVGMMKRQ
jgi:hypothetical protein